MLLYISPSNCHNNNYKLVDEWWPHRTLFKVSLARVVQVHVSVMLLVCNSNVCVPSKREMFAPGFVKIGEWYKTWNV